MDRLRPFLEAPALWLLVLDAAAIVAVWSMARLGRAGRWGGVTLRVLAALGLVIPGFTILDWYRDLDVARPWARELPIDGGAVAERFAANAVALLTLGFFVLVAGIHLARRVDRGAAGPNGESRRPEVS